MQAGQPSFDRLLHARNHVQHPRRVGPNLCGHATPPPRPRLEQYTACGAHERRRPVSDGQCHPDLPQGEPGSGLQAVRPCISVRFMPQSSMHTPVQLWLMFWVIHSCDAVTTSCFCCRPSLCDVAVKEACYMALQLVHWTRRCIVGLRSHVF